MGLIPKITCRQCTAEYSALRTHCPNCGAPRPAQPTRVPPTTAAATPGTAARSRAESDAKWQVVFGAALLAAVILATIVLIATGGSGGKSPSPARPSGTAAPGATSAPMSFNDATLPTPSPSPVPTPDATPTPAITSIGFSFLNNPITAKSVTMTQIGALSMDLDANVSPPQDNPVYKWSSSNETVLKVSDTGVVTIVGASPVREVHATITVECLGLSNYLTVYVPSYHAAYLTENLYDPDYVDEMDVTIYATPAPNVG